MIKLHVLRLPKNENSENLGLARDHAVRIENVMFCLFQLPAGFQMANYFRFFECKMINDLSIFVIHIERIHSRVQQPCKFIGTMKSVNVRKQQHGRRLIREIKLDVTWSYVKRQTFAVCL